MKIPVYPPQICWDFTEPTADNLGWLFSYRARFDWLTQGIPFDAQQAAFIIKDLDSRLPLSFMDGIPVFILPGELRIYDPRRPYGWGESSYHGRAYPSHIIIGAKLKENLASTLTHEIGHALTYCLVDSIYEDKINSPKLEEYRILRGLDPIKYGYGADWDERIFEVFAEDVRWHFGSTEAHEAAFTPYRPQKQDGPEPPDERIKAWMLSLIAPLPAVRPIKVEIVGQQEEPEPIPTPQVEPAWTFTLWVKQDIDGKWKVQAGAYNTRPAASLLARRMEYALTKAGQRVKRVGY